VSWLLVVTLAKLAAACEAPAELRESEVTTSVAPLDGLDSSELARFQTGAREFGEVETVSEGLGPFFNGSSCGHCHVEGGLGGGGVMRVTRVMCRGPEGELDAPPSGSLLHVFSTRPDVAAPAIPSECDGLLAERRTTGVLGAGLIEAIADEQILAEEVAQQGRVDGRAAIVTDLATSRERVGRFGWKSQHATLDSFAADAYRNELGITNELIRDEVVPEGDPARLQLMDPLPDPEAPVGAVAELADFMRFSAPLLPNAAGGEGLAVFRSAGCADCHRESYRTADGTSALAGREVFLYSDLLLHDVGTGDGIPQGAALAWELRTPPLWGLGRASFFLHDGSAASIDAAVLAHAGQASAARTAYAELSDTDRAELLAFLEGL
jgi:CxxC motif-containing protein (DUF1111 family)